jgi:hypothetical protein
MDDLRTLLEQGLQRLDAAVHAHLARVQARQDAQETLLLSSFPADQLSAVRARLQALEQSHLEARLEALDRQSGSLAGAAGEIVEAWQLHEDYLRAKRSQQDPDQEP